MNEIKIIFHADDFGANREISEHILDCFRNGALNSLSVLPNSSHLEECMQLLEPYRNEIAVSIHFNLAEGHCVASPEEVPLLVDERGMFAASFFQVLMWSFTGKRKELKRQIRTEMKAQLENMLPYLSEIRIDSHQHYHMIPAVMKSIFDGIEELKLEGKSVPEIQFIRIPAEPISPFLKQPAFYKTYRPINLVKNVVLNVLNMMDSSLLKPYRKKSAVFFGILLSGKMDIDRVVALRPAFENIAKKKGIPLEILCHPGGVKQSNDLMDVENKDCVEFYLSEGRKIEKEMLLRIIASK